MAGIWPHLRRAVFRLSSHLHHFLSLTMIFHFSSITLNHSESHPPLKCSEQTIIFARFIQHLANGTTLSIVTFGMQARLVLPPTVVTDTNRESLYGRVRMVFMIMTLIMVVVLMMMSAVVVMVMLVFRCPGTSPSRRGQQRLSSLCSQCFSCGTQWLQGTAKVTRCRWWWRRWWRWQE